MSEEKVTSQRENHHEPGDVPDENMYHKQSWYGHTSPTITTNLRHQDADNDYSHQQEQQWFHGYHNGYHNGYPPFYPNFPPPPCHPQFLPSTRDPSSYYPGYQGYFAPVPSSLQLTAPPMANGKDNETGIVHPTDRIKISIVTQPRRPPTGTTLAPNIAKSVNSRERKNAMARILAHELKGKVQTLKKKSIQELTEDEKKLYEIHEERRCKKNERSRERAAHVKGEIKRILSMSERNRSKLDKAFLESTLRAKQRKNERDRNRRSQKISRVAQSEYQERGEQCFNVTPDYKEL